MQENKKVVITGGGGFLGRQLALALKDKHEVVLACRDQASADAAQAATGCVTVAMDITDIAAIRAAFDQFKPQVVIHAAAMKSVAQAEREPIECSEINVVGSQNLARVAMETDCESVLGISSNRATPPTSDTYGLTKAILERMFCSLNDKGDTRFSALRLGNIAWSDGSVLTEWQRMLDDTGVISTTGPEMRRFFLTPDQAVAAVIRCLDHMEDFQGKVVAEQMKHAQVKDLLAAFIEAKGGSWQATEGRAGDLDDELLVGDLELPYCSEEVVDGRTHYIFAFNDAAKDPMPVEISTQNSEPMTAAEIAGLVAAGGTQ